MLLVAVVCLVLKSLIQVQERSTGPLYLAKCGGIAITIGAKTYLIGGINASNQKLIKFSALILPQINGLAANMPTARSGHKLVWFENRIWQLRWD